MDRFIPEQRHANLLSKVAKEIFDLTYKDLDLDLQYKYHINLSAKLYPIGSMIHFFSKNKHSYYIIQANLEYGFSHKDTMLIATLDRYAKRKLPSKEHYHKYKELLPNKDTLDKLSFILSIAVALLTHRPCKKDFELVYEDKVLYIKQTKHKLRVSYEAMQKLNYIKELKVKFC
jgi:exopolyphosphatase/guanosine-5'-triphosphate,3'-diphosphate pyrophosphatase